MTISMRHILLKPICYAEIYLCVIAVLFFFGPIRWEQHNLFYFSFLLFLYYYFFWKGYHLAINSSKVSTWYWHEDQVIHFLNKMIIVNLVFTMIAAIRYIGLQSFSITAMVNSVILGVIDAGVAYKNKFDSGGELYGGAFFSSIYVFLAPLLYPILPLAMFYFGKLKLRNKIFFVLTVIIEIIRWVAVGTNKGVFDIFFIIITILFLKSSIRKISNVYTKRKSGWGKKVIVLLLFCLILGYFGNNISSRLGGKETINLSQMTLGEGAEYNPNSIFSLISPSEILPVFVFLDSYLTQGYYSTSIAITETFTPMLGIGNSMFLIDNFNFLFDDKLLDYSYQAKIEKYGIDRFVNWHSFYTWVANDVSFLGVVFVMFLLGYLGGAIYKDVLYTRNPIAIVLFCLFTQIVLYIPANNQIFAQPISFMAFVCLLMMWLIRRYRLKVGKYYII